MYQNTVYPQGQINYGYQPQGIGMPPLPPGARTIMYNYFILKD